MTPEQALSEAKRILADGRKNGGNMLLAAKLGISDSAVSQWKRCPANRVLEVEAATRGEITRHQLRPDVFGPASSEAA